MNDLYDETIEVRGRVYRYDPDFDCYYRSHYQEPLTLKQRIAQCSIALVLLAVVIVLARTFL